jgi:hypothetical protein
VAVCVCRCVSVCVRVCAQAAPRLLQYLETRGDGDFQQVRDSVVALHCVSLTRTLITPQARWEELILRLLEKTLAIADDDQVRVVCDCSVFIPGVSQWAMDLADQYAAQFALYAAPADADLKKVRVVWRRTVTCCACAAYQVALKHMGVVLQKLQARIVCCDVMLTCMCARAASRVHTQQARCDVPPHQPRVRH